MKLSSKQIAAIKEQEKQKEMGLAPLPKISLSNITALSKPVNLEQEDKKLFPIKKFKKIKKMMTV